MGKTIQTEPIVISLYRVAAKWEYVGRYGKCHKDSKTDEVITRYMATKAWQQNK